MFKKREKRTDGIREAGRKRRVGRIWLIGATALLLCVAGVYYRFGAQSGEQIPKVAAALVTRGDIQTTVSVSGVVESEISQVYYAPMAAKVSQVNVALGDAVSKGETMVSYDTEDLEYRQKTEALDAQASESSYQSSIAESDKNAALYQQSAEELVNIEQMIDAQEAFIKQLQYYVEDETSRRKLKLYDERYRLNKRVNNLSVQAYIEDTEGVHVSQAQAMNELEEVERKLQELETNEELTNIERQIVLEQEKLADLEIRRDELKADKNSSENGILDSHKKKELEVVAQKGRIAEQQAQAHLEEALAGVKAGFNGIVTELEINEGFVTEAGSKLLKLESSDDVRVDISLSKYDLSKVKLGQKAEVEISGQQYEGTVSKIERMAKQNDAGTRLVTAQVHIEDPDDQIYLGIEGKVTILAQSSEDTLLVPVMAVNTDMSGDFCYVIADGIVERRSVTTGLSTQESIEIKEGLKEGDIVLTDTSRELTDGMQAEPLL